LLHKNLEHPVIRLALPSEAELVRTLSSDAYLPAYVPLFGRAPTPAVEDYAPRIGRGEVWISEIGDRPVAVLVLEKCERYLLVYSIAVRPAYQGRGLAARLLAFADEQARLAACTEIRLYTNEKMLRNQAIYRRAGYHEIGRRPHPSQPGLMLIDMAKLLVPPI
jgi:ribosomal protein S18 acetylase RimI-like enzyme